jgi:pimeloyl-ACP methyl ester carboxylesterase
MNSTDSQTIMKWVFSCIVFALAILASANYNPSNDSIEGLPPSGGDGIIDPWPVRYYVFTSQRQTLYMAYMDVHPKTSNGKTIILMHGKNYCGATWEATARVLLGVGYRVIMADQVGWCKSIKPTNYQYSLQQLSLNTYGLLQHLGVKDNLTVMGHSIGGMTATRFALLYPANTTRLVLVDPVGLEDWKAKGVPYQSIDITYTQERASNYTSIRAYEQATYYGGNWTTAYDKWVNMLVSVYSGPKGAEFAYDMALITDAVYTQPVVYEFSLLKMPTLLFVGDFDNTAIGKAWSPPAVQAVIGHYSVLGKEVVKMIPNGTLIEFPNLGHAPQIQDPDTFHAALLGWLEK